MAKSKTQTNLQQLLKLLNELHGDTALQVLLSRTDRQWLDGIVYRANKKAELAQTVEAK